jgi:hypothetical protein
MMRKNEFYTADIEIAKMDGTMFRPSYLGSLNELAEWAYHTHLRHQNSKLKITTRKVIFTNGGTTYADVPPLSKSEIKEVIDLTYLDGDFSAAWLFCVLGLATPKQLQLT